MVVIINNGETVKKFGVAGNAAGYAAEMARKGNDVWLVSNRVAHQCEFI